MEVDNKNSLLHGQKLNTDFQEFENSVRNTFEKIEEGATAKNKDQLLINGMENILKDFHIYWNSMRLRKKT